MRQQDITHSQRSELGDTLVGYDGSPSAAEELRRLRLLIDRLPAMIGYWDTDLRNVVANDAYFRYFGRTPGDIRGLPMREIVGESVFERVGPYAEKALQGHPQRFESTLTDPEGMLRHFETSYVPDIVDGEVRGFFVQSNDVTARVQAERSRDEALRFFQLSTDNAPFGKAVVTTTGEMLLVNPALCALVGYRPDEVVGRDYRGFVHPDDVAAGDEEMGALLSGAVAQINSERRYIRRDGTTIWMQRSAVLVPGTEPGAPDVVIAQFQDVTARRLAEAELARLAVTDQLTGLYNRRALVQQIAEHRRTDGPAAPVGLIFIDVDGFKLVNDIHGHAAGDTVLAEVAHRMNEAVPEPNSVYRLGGDEFVVLVLDADSDAAVADLAAAVSWAATGRYTVEADHVDLTASVGWTWGHEGDVEDLIRKADVDMYRHKARRRESTAG
ncbi:sensor domain-containing diguanylate cyclase [Mycobacterium sp. shizuoka-1]|uniref:sensor domain-containing diguanylate cyclase n=1 Tax=Mycobacterium sp. shizuoka-1 TaxID=2039281 RepID=UPI00115B0530|nr:sensor domain-containing diguanylate cyclase [Mycobacterium sp. shizuoka-1]